MLTNTQDKPWQPERTHQSWCNWMLMFEVGLKILEVGQHVKMAAAEAVDARRSNSSEIQVRSE
jgi:hypothetical protein